MSTYVISSQSTDRAFAGALTDACTRVTIEGAGPAPASSGGPPARYGNALELPHPAVLELDTRAGRKVAHDARRYA